MKRWGLVLSTVLAVLAALAAPMASAAPAGQISGVVGAPKVYVDGTDLLGPVDWAAAGFLHGDATNPLMSQELRPQLWRTSFAYGPGGEAMADYLSAREHGAQVIWILSDDWQYLSGNHASPWDDLAKWDEFVKWDVARHMAEAPVDYWDIWNEPSGVNAADLDLWLEVFQHAYHDIKSVDPSAKVEAPSGGCFDPFFDAAAGCQGTNSSNFEALLSWSAQNDLEWSAVTWHDLGATPASGGVPGWTDTTDIAAQAEWLRQTINTYDPALDGVPLQANEYYTLQQDVPGWVAGVIGAMDDAGIDGVHACFFEPELNTSADPGGINCQTGNLDGLLTPAGQPRAGWWVYRAYAEMVGERIATASSAPAKLSAFATLDDAHREIRVLVGRHETYCWDSTWPSACPSGPPAPEQVGLNLKVPWPVSSVTYTVKRLAAPPPAAPGTVLDSTSPFPNTSTTSVVTDLRAQAPGFQQVASGTARVSGGIAAITLGGTSVDAGVGDGDAYEVYVDAGSGPAPDVRVPPMAKSYCPIGTCTPTGPVGTFQATGSMYTPVRQAASAVLPGGKVLVAGGYFNTSERWAHVYDPATGTWSPAGVMGTPRYQATATTLGSGNVLVAGGTDGGSLLSSAELYDQRTNSWEPTGSMAQPRAYATATALPDGMVLVAGGYSTDGAVLSSAELYDPSTGSWSAAAPMTTPRAGATASLLPNGDVLLVGGFSEAFGPSVASAELYDPSTDIWTPTGSMATARAYQTATVLDDGRVLVAGGSGTGLVGLTGAPDPSAIASAELYDPATGTWGPAGSLPGGARVGASAALLADGDVLFAGGMDGAGTVAGSAYLYDPAHGTWSLTGPMSVPRAFFAMAATHSCGVLVAGGQDGVAPLDGSSNGALDMLSSADIYESPRPCAASADNGEVGDDG